MAGFERATGASRHLTLRLEPLASHLLCPNFWVNGSGIGVRGSLEMVLLIENQLIFVLISRHVFYFSPKLEQTC